MKGGAYGPGVWPGMWPRDGGYIQACIKPGIKEWN